MIKLIDSIKSLLRKKETDLGRVNVRLYPGMNRTKHITGIVFMIRRLSHQPEAIPGPWQEMGEIIISQPRISLLKYKTGKLVFDKSTLTDYGQYHLIINYDNNTCAADVEEHNPSPDPMYGYWDGGWKDLNIYLDLATEI